MQEVRSTSESTTLKVYLYMNQDYLVYLDSERRPVLEFRNGKRQKEVIERILKMCGMKVKEEEKDFFILEAANG